MKKDDVIIAALKQTANLLWETGFKTSIPLFLLFLNATIFEAIGRLCVVFCAVWLFNYLLLMEEQRNYMVTSDYLKKTKYLNEIKARGVAINEE